jgi:hypothetical protein
MRASARRRILARSGAGVAAQLANAADAVAIARRASSAVASGTSARWASVAGLWTAKVPLRVVGMHDKVATRHGVVDETESRLVIDMMCKVSLHSRHRVRRTGQAVAPRYSVGSHPAVGDTRADGVVVLSPVAAPIARRIRSRRRSRSIDRFAPIRPTIVLGARASCGVADRKGAPHRRVSRAPRRHRPAVDLRRRGGSGVCQLRVNCVSTPRMRAISESHTSYVVSGDHRDGDPAGGGAGARADRGVHG